MSSKDRDEVWEEWRALVNMAPGELEDWLATDESRSVGDSDGGESTGHRSGRRIVEIRRTKKAELSDADWRHMAKVVGYIKRHCSQGGPEQRRGALALALQPDELGARPAEGAGLRLTRVLATSLKKSGGHFKLLARNRARS